MTTFSQEGPGPQEGPEDAEARRESDGRYRLLVEGARDYAMILLDADGRVTGWNAGAERILGWTEAEALGQPADLIFTPEDRAAGVPDRELGRARAEGRALDRRWHVTKTGRRFWADGLLERLGDGDGPPRGFAKILRDATEERAAADALQASEEALRVSEARLRDAQARLETSMAAGGIATWTWDVGADRVAVDAGLARLFGVSPEDAAGGRLDAYLRAVHPEDRPRVAGVLADAVAGGDSYAGGDGYEAEYRVAAPGGPVRWLVARGRVARDESGRAVSLDGVVVDITEQAGRIARERFLAGLAERARRLDDPDAVIADAVRSVGEFLGVSRCTFADIDFAADTCAIRLDYCADSSVASIVGVIPLSSFGPFIVAEFTQGRAVVVDDVRADPVRVPPENVAAYESLGVRAHVTVPLVYSDRLVSCIGAHSAVPRRWTPEEAALLRDVVERTWLTVEVLRQQRARAREAETTARTLESITDAFFALDADWRFTSVNPQAERVLQRPRAELLGRAIWDAFPQAIGSTFEREYRRAVADGVPVSFEEYFPPLQTWFEVRAFPSEGGLSVFFQDVNARRRAAEALRESEERYRLLVEGTRDYAMILLDADGRVTGWNAGAERILGWTEAEALGQPTDLIFTPEDRAAGVPAQELGRARAEGRATNLRWHVRKDGRRLWADGVTEGLYDDGRLRGFAQVMRDATERKRLEDERADLAETNRLLLDSTADGIYGLDPSGRFTFINRAAERMLGLTREQVLGHDGHALIHHSLPDGEPFPVAECPIYHTVRDGAARRVDDDVFWRADGAPVPVAYSASPVRENGGVRGAVVSFTDISERKAIEAERERLASRERNISRQLQQALQPGLPGTTPGLAVSKFYEAALAEAGVGGDFYDVFPLEKGCTALVVGDLSGKGLAAAAQVATVRNMLRAFLYTRPTLAEAVTALNDVLAENDLLSGFTTLFVGAYDAGGRTLTYVNCGQEPALVRRRAGGVEPLPPTGPILGSIEGVRFEQQAATLAPGDAVAIFTDGLTEVGVSRLAMLGLDGVTALLAGAVLPPGAPPAEDVAEFLTLRLIGGVDAAAESGVMRDDMCLLVAVAA